MQPNGWCTEAGSFCGMTSSIGDCEFPLSMVAVTDPLHRSSSLLHPVQHVELLLSGSKQMIHDVIHRQP